MNRYDAAYVEALKSDPCPDWTKVCIGPLVADLTAHLGVPVRAIGPCGVRSEILIKVEGIGWLTITPYIASSELRLMYDTGDQTDRFEADTIGAINGCNNVTAFLPDTIEEIAKLLK